MLIIIHVLIALAGLVQATYGLILPSHGKLRATYVLTAATFASGSYLVWRMHSPILQSCLSGLAYLGFVITATIVSQYRLRKASQL
ncbi:MAG TPA: hypothetical protein VMB52_02365 [Verrucomicrobiae bacterium]|nr:hypothetical protein [Verrucomicrobiae bacterium]